ncbi:MAG: hypothetical protein RR495_03985 [Anaerovoracaceae bacterium]
MLIKLLLIMAGAIILGIFLGNGAVYGFNHIPPSWLNIKDKEDRQRINSYPWKYVFSMFFIIVGIYLGVKNWHYALSAVITMFILLEITIGSKKYQTVPNQLFWLLGLSAVSFVPFHTNVRDMFIAMAIGIVTSLVILTIPLLLKKGVDYTLVPLGGICGLIMGTKGILWVITIGCIAYLLYSSERLKRKKKQIGIVPFISILTIIYLGIVFIETIR